MNDIKFPAWVTDSPTLAMASVLSRLLIEESTDNASPSTAATAAVDGGRGQERSGNAGPDTRGDAFSHEANEYDDGDGGGSSSTSRQSGYEDVLGAKTTKGTNDGSGVADSGYLRMVDRLMDLNSKALDSLQPSSTTGSRTALVRTTIPAPTPYPQARSQAASPLIVAVGSAFARRSNSYNFGGEKSSTASADILHDARVRTLLRLSRLKDVLTSSAATQPVISQRTAAAMISFFGFAVSCRAGGIPAARTKGFFTECSSLYTTLFSKLRTLRFACGVNVEDFTASLVACGLKLRDDDDDESDEARSSCVNEGNTSLPVPPCARSAASTPAGAANNGNLRPSLLAAAAASATNGRERNMGLAGFGYRALDAIFVSNIPSEIDACVGDTVALGVIRGVALTYSQQLFYLGPDLVNHMHDLTDAFATSTHRRELPFKRVLSILLEAISCSRVIDYERTNNWITAIIQETYVVRGLFQRDVLHAHVVSATLTLLIRQYQEMAKECAAKVVDLGAMPDFTEGDQLMELVWKALHDIIGSWEDAVATAERRPLTLFRHNVEIVVQHLLRTEVERLRCYYVITSATTAYQESLIAPLSQSTSQQPCRTPESVDIPLAAATQSPAPPAMAPTNNKSKAARSTAAAYIPSEEEEALRLLICSNIVKLLLLPTSIMNALPPSMEASQLRWSLTAAAARVLSVVTAIEFNSSNTGKLPSSLPPSAFHPHSPVGALRVAAPAADEAAADALTATRQRAHFSNNFYRRIELVLHELIQTVLQQPDDAAAAEAVPSASAPASPAGTKPTSPRSQVAAPAHTAVGDAMMRGVVAATCMQHMCSTNHHLRTFAVSEVMDAIVRISARRGLDNSVGSLTNKALGRSNTTSTFHADPNANAGEAAAATLSSVPEDLEEARRHAEQRRARRLALCFDAMSSIMVPTASYVEGAYAEETQEALERLLHPVQDGSGEAEEAGHESKNANVSLYAVSKREELSRYGQLLCDTYVDSLREHLWRVAESNSVKRKVPTPVMSVAAKAFMNLVLRVHERLFGMSRVAFNLSQEAEAVDSVSGGSATAAAAASESFAKERTRLLRAFNAESVSVMLLLRGAIQSMLSVAWPSSGVLYQNPLDGSRRPLDSTTTPAAVAPSAFTAITPFLRPLALLLHLSTLFPALSLQQLCTHYHYSRYLTAEDPSTTDQYVFHYYRRLSRSSVATGDANVGTAEERTEHECRTIFRSCWMMFSHYKFTAEALMAAQSGAGGPRGAAAAAGLSAVLGRSPILSTGQCKLFRLIAASAAPLLRMCSSDIQQSMADIAVLMRYSAAVERTHADVAADVSATSGTAHHNLRKALRQQFGGSADHWSRLTTGELVLMQSIAELEILRAAAGSVAQLTLYRHFEVREFVASPTMPRALTAIIETACEQYVRAVGAMLPSVAYQVVRTDLLQLVFLLSFAIASVRESASKLAVRIVECFPGYAAHASALPLLWCVLDLLDSGTAAQIEAFCNYVSFAEVPSVAADPHSADRQQQIVFVSSVAETWASLTQTKAPQALFDTAVKFMVIQQQECGEGAAAQAGGRQAGSRLAVLASQQQQQQQALTRRDAQSNSSSNNTDGTAQPGAAIDTTAVVRGARAAGRVVTPNYAQSLLLHGRAQGTLQAAGWYASVRQVEDTVTAQLQLATRLSRRALVAALTQRLQSALLRPARALFAEGGYAVSTVLGVDGGAAAAKENDEGTVAEVRVARGSPDAAAMERAATAKSFAPAVALLVLGNGTPSGRRRLIQYLVQGPVQTFRSDVLYDAILCWKWLLSQDREAYLLPILQEVDTALEWTAANRLGLFDGYRASKNKQVQTGEVPLNSGGNRSNDGGGLADADRDGVYTDTEVGASPHKLLLSFLADMYVSEGNPLCLSVEVLRQLYSVAAHMMQFSTILSLRDEMFGEVMRCMLVVGSIARTLREANMRRLRSGLVTVVPFSAIGALRQRWYKALLRWFSKTPPSWYYAKDLVLATEESMVVRSLAQLLREEDGLLARTTLGFLDFSSGIHSEKGTPVIHRWESLSVVREGVAAVRQAPEGGETGLRKIIAKEQARLKSLLELLLVLVNHEILRLDVWRSPRRTLKLVDTTPVTGWDKLVECADHHNPAVVVAMTLRFASIEAVRMAASQFVVASPERYSNVSEAADLYLTEEVLAAGAPRLFLFRHCTIIQSLRLLDPRYAKHKNVASYAIRSLLYQRSEELIFYLPQMLQLLAIDKSGGIQSFLMRMCAKSTMFAHQLLWSLQTEGQGNGVLAKKCQSLEKQVKEAFTPAQMDFYRAEFDFVGLVTSLSGELMKFEKPQRKSNLRQRLKDDHFNAPPATQHLYLPTDPEYRITGVIPHTAGAMQSAAKCPILVQFTCVKRALEDVRTPAELAEAAQEEAARTGAHPAPPTPVVKACIFKMGDDCRQDQISLQLIGLMQRILCSVGVPSYLYPYRVVTTGQDSGIIECVPHSMSRNEIGKLVESNLAEFFVQTFGHPEAVSFRSARENFVKSTAAYSVVSFILNIKDRHNGNIMIDNTGNLVHIDFGFLFDTSPGGDINFESSPFKLTTEMVQLIGMDVGGASTLHSKSLARALVDEENYIYFKTLVNRCYLAVRQYAREICILVELMLHSGLPCFKPKKTIRNLAERLAIDKNEVEAAAFMRRRIHEARQNYRTVLYDYYQKVAEGIEM
ncbi:putative phosphatidylinositol-kinase domain protein [Leptomonas pyrrhocoris]|uniref:1-phosphatidylinositol 4-kinase n=1 Tax=Leptomonas pyrrhocoris TaxID=157538 RepID=A0A0N0DVK5_LEPPY|nr:putative phosphatidylinositol-kinase domain protein [Leptomonas pyrrhocoris]KPA80512.1 putative phosphatidylinositol-kinase domain protein [Leptomonas pyrrhocoris]|eukprot:XP_015658951.1 putative phosphatidylinositol-kinase domain protein [Leptomonas pyrrhocoris]